MKRWPVLIGSMLSLMALLSVCNGPPPPPVDHPNLLVAVDGEVQLKREGWSEYTTADFGTLIQYDDLLKVNGTAAILCGDLTLKTLEGLDSCPCPPGPGLLSYEGAHYRKIPDNAPYIQHPRNTLVLDARPLLRWHDTGAGDYTIAIMQGGKPVWGPETITGHEIEYPAGAPPLQPGEDYLLVVRDNDTRIESGKDPTPGIGFQVIAADDRATIETHRDEILALSSLDGPARNFALAVYYATWQAPEDEGGEGRGLWGEAWLLLESVAQTHNTPAVHLWMGGVLAAMKLPDEAEAAYQDALQRAKALGDVESQAAAYTGLWRVTENDTNREKAITLYEKLGDKRAVEALQ